MFYLATQIWLHLLLAFAGGAAVLWWWRRSNTGMERETGSQEGVDAEVAELESRLAGSLADLREANQARAANAEELGRQRVEWGEQAAAFRAEIETLRNELRRAATPPMNAPTTENSEPRLPEGLLLDPSPPLEARDDLKKIRGVGRVLEGLLHEMNIHTFREIAEWDVEDIERIQSRLPRFPGRIRRDSWVDQAAALAQASPSDSVS